MQAVEPLDQSEQTALLFWINTPRFSRRRRRRQRDAIKALQQGTEDWSARRPDVIGGLLDGIFDALLF